MSSPGNPERVFLPAFLGLLGLGLMLGCGRPATAPRNDAGADPPRFEAGLVARGSARGPLPGIGPRLEWQAWMRPGRDLRADLRFSGPRGERHEVLVWTGQAAVLFDRRGLRYATLGERRGELDGLQGSFRVAELWWLLLGGGEQELLPGALWELRAGQWRGRAPGKGYRRPQGEDPLWAEILWRGESGEVHVLRAWRRETWRGAGGSLATRLDLVGSDLDGLVRVSFERPVAVALGDSILDPVWEPN